MEIKLHLAAQSVSENLAEVELNTYGAPRCSSNITVSMPERKKEKHVFSFHLHSSHGGENGKKVSTDMSTHALAVTDNGNISGAM